MKEITSIHKDHRKRVRDKFDRVGLEGFADHEILELLLFYAIPYKDTNPLSHELIARFGSFENVFAASKAELMSVKGISDTSATLIQLIPQLSNKLSQKLSKKCAHISGWTDAIRYCSLLYENETKEKFYLICLDNRNNIRCSKLISSGDSTSTVVDVKEIVKYVATTNYKNVILSHNHPIGGKLPSNEDLVLTRQIVSALALLGITVLDHIIVSPIGSTSMAFEGIISKINETVPETKTLHKVSDKKSASSYTVD